MMNDIERAEAAYDYALQHRTFSKTEIVRAADQVCVFGLGKYFEDAFIRQDIKHRFHVTHLCDNSQERIAAISRDERYAGLKCILPKELKTLSNPVVIFMLGDPRSAMEQISGLLPGGLSSCVTYNDLILDDIMEAEKSAGFYEGERARFIEALQILADDRSRQVFTDVFALRVAPHLAKMKYEDLCVLPQYFPHDVYTLGKEEIVADCGAYTGDTFEEFYRITGGLFREYHAFEMDRENYRQLCENTSRYAVKQDSIVRCYPYGVWSEDGEISYGRMSSADSYSIFNGRETEKAKVVSLDSFLLDVPVTLIKMDIEGSEQAALRGCRELIARYRPRMAICVYHRVEDLWQIPLFLKHMNPDYRIHIRHHAKWWVAETVCYAV